MSKRLSLAKRDARAMNAEANGQNGKTLVAMEAGIYGGGTIEPLMPSNLMFENVFRAFWRRKKGADQYKQARELSETSDFLAPMIYLKDLFFNDSFSFGEATNPKLQEWLKKQGYDFSRVVNDTWQEWLICDNVVAFWVTRDDGELPTITIFDCEICEYKNAFGIERLKIKLPKLLLSGDDLAEMQAKGLDDRYIKALKEGKELTLDEAAGEHFKVLTRAKLGKGLAPPRVGSILQQLSTMELFGVGDWAAAAQMKKVMRQIQKGHEIRNGPLAGQAMHFLKSKESKAMKNALQNKDGAFDSITNFDVAVKYPFIDPRYFDAKKMEGTLERLERWAGPLAMMMSNPQMIPNLIDLFEAEGRHNRNKVGNFLSSIFNDPSFIGEGRGTEATPALVPQWNAHSFTTQKMLNELVRLGVSNGLVSPQTSREWLQLDDTVEGDRMEAAAKKRKRYTPVFEAKQGLVAGSNKGGRPQENPANPAAP